VVYARRVGDRTLTFIVSGKLWRDSLIMMDRETRTLWSHVTGEAIHGELKGTRLEAMPVAYTTWERWKAKHPDTLVLMKDEPVNGSPYEAYQNDPERFGMTRAKRVIEKLPGKAVVHGAVVGGEAVAVTDQAMQEKKRRKATVSGREILFRRSADGAIRAFEADSENEIPVTRAYWFAWIAFYPGTQLLE
jgi:hypothetical protein